MVCPVTHLPDFFFCFVFFPRKNYLMQVSPTLMQGKDQDIPCLRLFKKQTEKILVKYKGLLLLAECNKSYIVCTWPISSFTSTGQKPLRDWHPLQYSHFNYILLPSSSKVVLKEKEIKEEILHSMQKLYFKRLMKQMIYSLLNPVFLECF